MCISSVLMRVFLRSFLNRFHISYLKLSAILRALSAFLRYLSLYFRLAFSGGTNRTVLLSSRKGTSPLSLSS
nr:MAG TPA: hypothetical protein [Caudoviricetes sp.]